MTTESKTDSPEVDSSDLLALVVFLAKHHDQLEALRYSLYAMTPEECKDAVVMNWPIVQGTRNQINLKQIGEMEYDSKAVGRAIAAILEANAKMNQRD
jgi:hypothetical protein